MKIRAVRLAGVGTFAEPVALEGLSGGLDVLAGPNELGKSTIFRAIETVFLQKHTAGGKAIDRLRARAGGEPLIEVDFETAAGRFRIRKQFGRGRIAELSDLKSGAVRARGGDADARVLELIGAGDDAAGGLPLLWVGQKKLLAPVSLDAEQHTLLSSVIEREIETVAAGPETRLVRESVQSRLDELMTSRGPKKNGPLDLALRERDRLAGELATAREEAQQAAARLDELERLRKQQAEQATPAQRGDLAAALAAAENATAEAEQRAQQLALARGQERALALEAERAAEALQRFDAAVEALAAMARQGEADLAGLAQATEDAAALEAAWQAAAARRDRLEADGIAAREAEGRAKDGARLGELGRRLDGARQAAVEIAAAEEVLSRNRATAAHIEELSGIEQRIALATARLEAAAAVVQVDYAAGGAGKVRVAGAALAGGVAHRVTAPLRLEIDGVGVLTVRPPPGDHEALAAGIEADRARATALLSGIGAATAPEARALVAARADAGRVAGAARARMAGLVGDGLEALAAEHGALAARLAAAPGGGTTAAAGSPAESEARLAALRRDYREAQQDLAQTERRRAAAQQALARLAAEGEARGRRRAEIEASLPPADERESMRARLAAAAAEARSNADEATRSVVVLRGMAPDADALALLAARKGEGLQALRRFDETARRLDEQIIDLKARVEQADEQGAYLRAAQRAGEHERAAADATRLSGEVEVLRLVLEALDDAEQRSRGRFLQPVVARIAPYLGAVFPDARLAFGEGLSIAGLERAGGLESLASLSDGTQEQLAVIVRLAFGRMLAEAGRPVPVILDDALVYADDERIARLFGALREAAALHQVLVMTCHERAFADLGGNRVGLGAWTAG